MQGQTDPEQDVFQSFGKAIVLLLLPLAELAALRWCLHSAFALRIGFSSFTDYDLALPVPIAFCILIAALERNAKCRLRVSFRWLRLNALSLGAFLYVSRFWLGHPPRIQGLHGVLWLALLTTIVASAVWSFSPPEFYLKNKNRIVLLPSSLIALSLVIYMNLMETVWRHMMPLFNWANHVIFPIFFGPQIQCSAGKNDFLRIGHPKLAVLIGEGCGGLESVLLLSFVFLILIQIRTIKLSPKRWAIAYALGVLGMFALNFVRLVLIFGAGIWLRSHYGMDRGSWLLKFVFHAHIGWILYSAAILAYVGILSWISERARENGWAPTLGAASEV